MSNNNSKKIVKNTGFLYMRMMVVMLISLFTSRIVLKTLGFENFGIYNVVGSVVVFLSFLQYALRNATFRYLTYEIGNGESQIIKETYSMAVNSHLLVGGLLFILMEIGGVWFLNTHLNIPEERMYAANWTFQLSLMNFFFGIIKTPFESNIIAHEKMGFYSVISVFEVVFKLFIVYILVVITYDKLIVYAALLTFVSGFILLLHIIYCQNSFKDCVYIRCWNKNIMMNFTKYSGWSLVVNVATITRTQSINIFFNWFLGILANAAMGVANQVVSVLNTFVTNFTQAYKPQIIKSWAQQDIGYFMKLIFSTSKFSYFLLLALTIPVIININFFLKLWLGEYPNAAPIYVSSILMYYLVDALQEPLLTSVHATGKLKYHQMMMGSIIMMMIPTAYVLLKLGYSGEVVLMTNAFFNVICAIVRTVYMKKLIKLDVLAYLKNVLLPVFIVTVVSLSFSFIIDSHFEETLLNVAFTSGVSFIFTIVVIYLIGVSKSEKESLKGMLSTKLRRNK